MRFLALRKHIAVETATLFGGVVKCNRKIFSRHYTMPVNPSRPVKLFEKMSHIAPHNQTPKVRNTPNPATLPQISPRHLLLPIASILLCHTHAPYTAPFQTSIIDTKPFGMTPRHRQRRNTARFAKHSRFRIYKSRGSLYPRGIGARVWR